MDYVLPVPAWIPIAAIGLIEEPIEGAGDKGVGIGESGVFA